MPAGTHTAATAPILRISDLVLRRPGFSDEPDYVLSVPSFEARVGSRIGLIGESGSGKTSFLELLGLLAWPDTVDCFDFAPEPGGGTMDLRPSIRAKDTDILSQLRARCIAFVLQDGGLLPYLTMRENAEVSRRLAGRPADRGLIEKLAAAMGIEGYLDRYQSALSGGQRQRAAVLRALSSGVPLLLADEPTASLDPVNSDAVLEAMVASADQVGATLIVASHNADLLRRFGFAISRVVVTETAEHRHASLVSA